jgi:hypothetical protein
VAHARVGIHRLTSVPIASGEATQDESVRR